jgi:hypothetical protein
MGCSDTKEGAAESSGEASSEGQAEPNEGGEQEASNFVAALLPEFRAPEGAECMWSGERNVPSFCDWAHSVDAIFVGEIVAMDVVLAPAVVYENGEQTLMDECAGNNSMLKPAIAIDVKVLDAPYGPLAKGQTLRVHVGPEQRAMWWPKPSANDEGEFYWYGNYDGPPLLVVGSALGLSVTKYPGTEYWSVMGDEPFTFDAEGHPVFTVINNCIYNHPKPQVDLAYSDFLAALASCEGLTPTEDAATRRMARLNMYGKVPDLSYAASCYPNNFHVEPPCSEENLCPDGNVCENGTCVWVGP